MGTVQTLLEGTELFGVGIYFKKKHKITPIVVYFHFDYYLTNSLLQMIKVYGLSKSA